MAKKSQKTSDESVFDTMFEAAIAEAKKKFPDQVYTGSEEAMRCISLAVPSLAIRYLFQQEGLPLERFILIVGPKESCKSAMGYEFIRWIRLQLGRGVVIEVEDKKSPELAQSILNYDAKAIIIERCDTLQTWSSALTTWLQKVHIMMDGDPKAPKARPGIGRKNPVLVLVDSIMAAVSDGVMADVEDTGHTKRRFAEEANLMSDYMKIFTKWLNNHPITVVGINHMKPTQTPQGLPQRHMPGGKAPEYHASMDIEMKKLGQQWKTVKEEGIPLKMKTQKNSLAPHAEIDVDMIWRIDATPTDSGEYLQRTYFDWHTSTWKMLEKFKADCGIDKRARLKSLLDFKFNTSKGTVESDALGIPDGVDVQAAGQILEQRLIDDADFTRELYAMLGIRRRPLFIPDVEYTEQMDAARTESLRLQKDREKFVLTNPTILGGEIPDPDVEDSILDNQIDGSIPFIGGSQDV